MHSARRYPFLAALQALCTGRQQIFQSSQYEYTFRGKTEDAGTKGHLVLDESNGKSWITVPHFSN